MNALVTGGGSGTGREVAKRLTAQGVHVTVWGRSAERVRTVVDAGDAAAWRAVDIADPDSVRVGTEALQAERGTVSLVVHCAGIWTPGALGEVDVAVIRQHIDAIVLGSVLVARSAETLIGSEPGQFIHVAAASAKPGFPDTALNTLAKRAQDGLHEGLTRELRGSGLRITAVYPDSVSDEGSASVAAGTAMSYADVADAILYASSCSSTVVPSEITLTARKTGRWE
ncbi:SDR family oxidoreductase [Streptomyces sp. NPDC005526]|uniref:SDR family oxidoreductase n=1 Tax=Streptomyces sp. NPDC005526 TaxID=3156885 RepID=UPI0033A270E4